MVWDIALGVVVGMWLWEISKLMWTVAWVALINSVSHPKNKTGRQENLYYPWQTRLAPDHPDYIDQKGYWTSCV